MRTLGRGGGAGGTCLEVPRQRDRDLAVVGAEEVAEVRDVRQPADVRERRVVRAVDGGGEAAEDHGEEGVALLRGHRQLREELGAIADGTEELLEEADGVVQVAHALAPLALLIGVRELRRVEGRHLLLGDVDDALRRVAHRVRPLGALLLQPAARRRDELRLARLALLVGQVRVGVPPVGAPGAGSRAFRFLLLRAGIAAATAAPPGIIDASVQPCPLASTGDGATASRFASSSANARRRRLQPRAAAAREEDKSLATSKLA